MTIRASLRNAARNFYNIFQFAVGSKEFVRASSETREQIKRKWAVILQPDYPEKFFRLTKGLDDKSIDTVARVLAKQQAILSSNKEFLDLLTMDEQQEIRLQKEKLDDQILRLSDDIFAYRNYLLPIRDFSTCVFYYKYGLNEMETRARVKGKTIVDAGGYIGDSALIFEELEPEKICVFEASPETFNLLKRTIKLNGLKNVLAENVALGAEKGECSLYVGMGARCTSIVKKAPNTYKEEIKVPMVSLDDYVAEHRIENIGLIKTDIEGAESLFLAGAKKTICEQKPILLISIYHNANDFFEIKPLIESWNLGYKFKIYKPTDKDVAHDTLLIGEVI